MYKIALLIAALLAAASAHSWVQCADYVEENGQYWNFTKCRAWPRDYVNKFTGTNAEYFGIDVGYDYQETQAKPCLTNKTSASYTTAFPAATYSPGQRVCQAWPPKNHVRANCQNPNIPDSGTYIYRSGVNPTSDPTYSEFQANVVYDFGADTVVGAGTGFQNCPAFCGNQDKALCTGCYNIPSDLALGTYTFLWSWSFNSPTNTYTSCFDVTIVANSGNAILSTLPHIGPDAFAASSTGTAAAAAGAGATASVTTGSSSSSSSRSSSSSSSSSHASSAATSSSSSSSSAGGAPVETTGATTAAAATTSAACSAGTIDCFCTAAATCNPPLVCTDNVCFAPQIQSSASSLSAGMVVLVAFVGLLLSM